MPDLGSERGGEGGDTEDWGGRSMVLRVGKGCGGNKVGIWGGKEEGEGEGWGRVVK